MANVNVSGTIKQNNDRVATSKVAYLYSSPWKIFDSENISATGNQYLSGDNKFSDYTILLFCQFTSGAGWRVIMLPTSRFVDQSSNSVIIEQNYTGENRRIHIMYVNDTTFNVSYIQNTNRFIIYGIQ